MIIGGGPAGMQAAQTASSRGHEVTLYERGAELGGRLREASALYCKEDSHRRYLHWDIRETQNCGAKLVFNTEVTPDLVREVGPDVVIIACGGELFVPPIKGANNAKVISVSDADLRRQPIGDKVVVLGGGLSGLECAIDLAHEGRQVSVIDSQAENDLWREVKKELRSGLVELKQRYGVKLIDRARIVEISDEGVYYERAGDAWTGERTGTGGGGEPTGEQAGDPTREPTGERALERALERTLEPGDSYVTSFGTRPNAAFIAAIKELLPDVYTVGDARAGRNIFWANMDAFNVAVEL
jgi:hypothetical protein